jgi:glutamate/tyrosine decarboxylase-like PLP-dependent enzyme
MHQFTPEVEELAKEVLEYSLIRLRKDPPLDGPKTAQELYELAGNTITENGLGGHETLKLFRDVLAKACISTDHPRYLAFIPSAPSEYANLFDLVVGASALYGGSWLEGAGAVFAENQALKWISDLANMPSTAGGVFAQGGTVGNLSALVTARNTFRSRRNDVTKWVIAASSESHASIRSAAEIMDVGILLIKPDQDGSLQGDACAVAIDKYHTENPGHQVFALVATAGTTNLGVIDNLQSIAECAKDRSIWFHVDGAYGLAALCAPSVRELFNGIEKADSFIVDPHKWLFAPYDACALIYKNPKLAKKAHLQKAAY